jgi:hypothetical protein
MSYEIEEHLTLLIEENNKFKYLFSFYSKTNKQIIPAAIYLLVVVVVVRTT